MADLAFLSRPARLLAGLCVALTLAACGPPKGEAPDLMRFRNVTNTPDEFVVSPARPLEEPPSMTLPPPTRGSVNRADARPVDDAITALGGSVAAANREGIPSGDQALVAQSGRYGRDPGIRETLAAEDIDYRRRNNLRIAERIAKQNGYFRAYARQSLDKQAEMDRLRARGVRVPAAPPGDLAPR